MKSNAQEGNNTNTKISFYANDTYVGPNPSSVLIAGVDSAFFEFGSTFAFDIPLFLEFEPNTTTNAIGKAKGIYTVYTRDDLSCSITMNLFLDEYQDSVLTFLGVLNITSPLREVPVVGGSGVFRGATGYFLSQVVFNDPITSNNIVKYDIDVNLYQNLLLH
ncbi:hypothetical protein ZOSMA_30G00390 [Zostera marina]|uniref:Dirigent protein n=1 Tax=Zostera marina TaxID=29655 RepID=A0A0K9P9K2_ZOSMR|nr:hypothetical protein ZOSMA_30G00390 [Zostera marina]